MDIENMALEMEQDVLEFLLQPQFKDDLEEAKGYFYNNVAQSNINDEIILDFNSWLIYDYKLKNHKTFLEKYFEKTKEKLSEKERTLLLKKVQSFLSVHQLKEIRENKGLFKDIFTNREMWIDLGQVEEMNRGDLILTRVIHFSDEYILFGSKVYFPGVLKNAIEKNMVPQYESYRVKTPYGNWEDFLKENSLLLYKHIGIIQDVVNQEVEDVDQYNVWQSIYLVKDVKKAKEGLLKKETIQLDFEEDGNTYFKIVDNEKILAEIVLEKNKLELECTSEKDRERGKREIEALLGDGIKLYKDEVIRFEDIV